VKAQRTAWISRAEGSARSWRAAVGEAR